MAELKIKMPPLGESVHEATLINWLVKPGDTVKKFESIAEVQSDKVTTEIPSEFDGVVKEYLVDVDDSVPIGTEILTLEGGEEKNTADQNLNSDSENTDGETPTLTDDSEQHRVSPSVVKLAQEKGIELSQVTGTGTNGRITKKDILNFTPQNKKIDFTIVSDVDRVEKASPTRKIIAQKMVHSATTIPAAWMMVETEVTNLVKFRTEVKDKFKKEEGISLSFFPFFVKAAADALSVYPKINASWDDGNIIYHNNIDISIAVATDDLLYVPVVRNANKLSVAKIAKEINQLAEKVRNGTITADEMSGGTFTVNNTGSFGSTASMGIINYPQAAILQVEGIKKRVVPNSEGEFAISDIVNLCLTIDHRLLDGLAASQYIKKVQENLARYSSFSDLY